MPTYSHSRIETYGNCPLKFKYTYVEKVPVERRDGIEAFLGSRVHDTFEKMYKDLRMEKKWSLEETLGYYSEIWEKNWSDSIFICRKEYDATHYRKIGDRCITDYYNRYSPFDQDKTLGLETNVNFALSKKGEYKITGYIDRLSEVEDGHYEIHDYKTGGYLPTQDKLDEDRQLALYSIAIKERFTDAKKVDLVWHYVAFDKEFRSSRTDKQLEELKKETLGKIMEIEAAKEAGDFPATESSLCGWCEFADLCPKKKHEIKVQDLPPNRFLKEPGVKLANLYAELMEKKAKITRETEAKIEALGIDELKEAIFKYAEKNSEECICGSDCKLKITCGEKLSFPRKSDAGREKLEALLRESKYWQALSDLSTSKLKHAVEDHELDGKLEKQITQYEIVEADRRISKSKLKRES